MQRLEDLPDPHYIAMHSAIAEVSDMSGAEKLFDEILHRYRDDVGNGPALRSWPELEALVAEGLQRERLIDRLKAV